MSAAQHRRSEPWAWLAAWWSRAARSGAQIGAQRAGRHRSAGAPLSAATPDPRVSRRSDP